MTFIIIIILIKNIYISSGGAYIHCMSLYIISRKLPRKNRMAVREGPVMLEVTSGHY